MANNHHLLPDRSALRELANLADDRGVLSMYVTVDPGNQRGNRPAWRIGIENQLTVLRERIGADPDRTRAKQTLARLDDLGPQIELALSTREKGLGRALFAPLSGGPPRMFSVQVPVEDRVVLEPDAYLRPLVEAYDRGAPCGAAVISPSGVRLVDIRHGLAKDVGDEAFVQPAVEEARRGPGQDRNARRTHEHLVRATRSAAAAVDRTARDHGWEALAIAGEPKLASVLSDALAFGTVVLVNEDLTRLGANEIATAVEPPLGRLRAERTANLTESTKNAALSGGRGVIGLGDTLDALHTGNADTLLIDPSREWEGGRTADGRLYPASRPPRQSQRLIPEQRMGERMIETALRSDCRVALLDTSSAGTLEEYEGVAAQLRR